MFNLGFTSVQIRRLGLGVAVAALALTTLISPASAVENTPGTGPATPKPEGDTSLIVPKKADIQVTARGKTTQGGTTYYYFMIKNNGPANATNITAYKEAHTYQIGGPGFALVDNGYFSLSLAAGQSTGVKVACTQRPATTASTARRWRS